MLIARIARLSQPMRQRCSNDWHGFWGHRPAKMATRRAGKQVGDNTCLHVEALPHFDGSRLAHVCFAETIAGIERGREEKLGTDEENAGHTRSRVFRPTGAPSS
jgi:hypothetical protein